MELKEGLDTQNCGKVFQLTTLFFNYNHSVVKPIYCIILHHNMFNYLFFITAFLCFMFLIFLLISLNFIHLKSLSVTLILLFWCKFFSICFHCIVFVFVRYLIICSLGLSANFVFWRSSVHPSRSTHHLFPPCSVSLKADLYRQHQQVLWPSGFLLGSATGKNHQENGGRGECEVKCIYSLTLLPMVLAVSLTEDQNPNFLLVILISLNSFQVCC